MSTQHLFKNLTIPIKKLANKSRPVFFILYSIYEFRILYHFSFIFQYKIKTPLIPVSSVLALFFKFFC